MKKLVNYFSLTVAYVYWLLPSQVGVWSAKILAFLWADVFKIRRQVVFNNMDIAFPHVDVKTKQKWMRFSIYVLAKSLFDLLQVPFVNDKWIKKNVVFHGFDELDKHPGGVLFLCMHTASGDLTGAVISHEKKPISLITKRFKSPLLDEFWFALRRRCKMQFIDAHEKTNAFEILKALKTGRGVAFVLDQFMGKPYGIETEFFNKKTGTAYGLALFAQKTKKPVFPLYSYWDRNGRLNVCVKPAVDLSELVADDIDKNNVMITNRFNQEIEKIITEHPEHWMWVHKRWKVFE